ncbi:unnamed protein product [Candidula unifasciata]|uniref:EGF-like domain-containing protein n=1 Tax=Candidula unifasciata TaxID=100452 RepID=A0A8S3YPR0_9EUPU|nr:unnamed protein product [Candidula unifasciata]
MAGCVRVLPSYVVLLLLQESVEWRFHRNLYEYKTYGAITLEIFNIPSHPVRVNINSSVESSSSSCPLMTVKIFSSQFGIPVVRREGESFPDKLFVSKTPVQNITVVSTNQSVVWQLDPVKPGQLYVMAILPRADTRIKQKGLQLECHYYVNLQATVLYYLDTDIYQLGFNRTHEVSLVAKSKTLFRYVLCISFKVPVDAKSYVVELGGCGLEQCPVNASVSETLGVSMEDGSSRVCHWVNGSCRLEVRLCFHKLKISCCCKFAILKLRGWSAHRLQHPSQCHTGVEFNASSLKDNSKNYVIIPYPQSGLWFVSLVAQCFHTDTGTGKEVLQPCKSPITANVTIRLSPCIDGGCLKRGVCKLFMESDLLFSACNCFSGWRGYGCNDGSQADDATLEIIGVYLLTLSNLCFIPGIVLAIRRRFYVEALVYSYNMFFSTFYHACDSSEIYQLCILPYNALSFADFFASLLSFWVTLMVMARISQGLRSFLHMLSALFISLGEVYNRHGLMEQLMPIAAGVFILLVSWALESYKRRTVFPSKQRLLWYILPGLVLAGAGLIVSLAFQTDSNYKYTHSTWHVLVSFSIAFLLPPGRKQPDSPASLSVQSGDITRQSVVGSQEFNASILHAHDAGTPDGALEPSSPPATPRNSREVGLMLLNRSHSRGSQNLVL